jgi:hypothetical protein
VATLDTTIQEEVPTQTKMVAMASAALHKEFTAQIEVRYSDHFSKGTCNECGKQVQNPHVEEQSP